jgi:hypothetical protein
MRSDATELRGSLQPGALETFINPDVLLYPDTLTVDEFSHSPQTTTESDKEKPKQSESTGDKGFPGGEEIDLGGR